jgi:predicted RNase H-like nuclease (RuvC/YqgF family)
MITLQDHIEELRAELRGCLTRRERAAVKNELEAAIAALKEGLARRQGQRIILKRDLLNTLRRRELDAAGARLSAQTGLPYVPAASEEHVAGTYRQRLALTSGRFAMIDNGLGFALVPWTPTLEKHLGRHVAGIAKDGGGGIEWGFGRRRGLEI